MVDEPDNLTSRMLRRMDEKLDRIVFDVGDLKGRMTSVERQFADVRADMAGMSGRLDHMDLFLVRIERRLELVEPADR